MCHVLLLLLALQVRRVAAETVQARHFSIVHCMGSLLFRIIIAAVSCFLLLMSLWNKRNDKFGWKPPRIAFLFDIRHLLKKLCMQTCASPSPSYGFRMGQRHSPPLHVRMRAYGGTCASWPPAGLPRFGRATNALQIPRLESPDLVELTWRFHGRHPTHIRTAPFCSHPRKGSIFCFGDPTRHVC